MILGWQEMVRRTRAAWSVVMPSTLAMAAGPQKVFLPLIARSSATAVAGVKPTSAMAQPVGKSEGRLIGIHLQPLVQGRNHDRPIFGFVHLDDWSAWHLQIAGVKAS